MAVGQKLRSARDALVYSNAWVALGAASLCEITLFGSGLAHGHSMPALLFFATLFAYNYHRLLRPRGASIPTHSERHRWIEAHARPLTVVMVLSGSVTGVLALRLGAQTLAIVAPIALVTLSYSVLPWQWKPRRSADGRGSGRTVTRPDFLRVSTGIRDLPFLKTFVVAATWAVLTALLPLVQEGGGPILNASVVMEVLERFTFIAAITVPFDVRDLPYDSAHKRTVPQLVGVRGAVWVSLIALAGFCAIVAVHPRPVEGVSEGLLLSALVTAGFLAGVREGRSELYFTGWIEGTMVIQYLMAVTVSTLVPLSNSTIR